MKVVVRDGAPDGLLLLIESEFWFSNWNEVSDFMRKLYSLYHSAKEKKE